MPSSLPEGIRLQKLKSEILLQERIVQTIARSLDIPIFYRLGNFNQGFWYAKPGWKHFCLLKAVRAVSGLNACVRLFEGGFSQEISVLIRTIHECTSHIDFIVAGLDGELLAAEQLKYVNAYFADCNRDAVTDFGRPRVRQGDVHNTVGAHVLYIGVTSDLERRMAQHDQGLIEGFTKRYGVKLLVYYEFHQSMIEAIRREKQLKEWRRPGRCA
jgi:predicted GIY-YIG superfamily endonuclease